MRIVLGGVAVLALAIGGAGALRAQTGAGAVDARAFGAREDVRQVSISPDGKRLAMVRAAARARGRKGGRKAKLNEDQVKQIRAMLKDPDIKVTDIARQYGACRATIFNAVGPVKPERVSPF